MAENKTEVSEARVRLRPETRRKWDAIKARQRWSYTEMADALADEFLKSIGLDPATLEPLEPKRVPGGYSGRWPH